MDLSFWGYGQPRGGTPAVLVPHCGRDAAAAAGDSDSDSCYLSFFHSATALGNFYRTYVFGAYTFSTSPPFRLLSFTPLPVLTKKFYTGSFAGMSRSRSMSRSNICPMVFFSILVGSYFMCSSALDCSNVL